jgi:hypothetical protein
MTNSQKRCTDIFLQIAFAAAGFPSWIAFSTRSCCMCGSSRNLPP